MQRVKQREVQGKRKKKLRHTNYKEIKKEM
jgi:hypothetical protein